jgi:hypothetical protein
MSFDCNYERRIVGEQLFQSVGILREYSTRFVTNIVLVVVEVDILNVRCENVGGRPASGRSRRRRRWWWRHRHINRNARSGRAARAIRNQRVGCRVAREHLTAAVRLNRADALIDRDVRRVLYAPSKRRCLSPLDTARLGRETVDCRFRRWGRRRSLNPRRRWRSGRRRFFLAAYRKNK